MRFIKLVLAAIIMIAVVLVAVANRATVTLKFLPDPIADIFGLHYQVTLPLFLVILAAVLIGLLVGYLLEWVRERKHRREVTVKKRELSKLETEVANMKKKTGEDEDEILALLN